VRRAQPYLTPRFRDLTGAEGISYQTNPTYSWMLTPLWSTEEQGTEWRGPWRGRWHRSASCYSRGG
jgi:hypothetical protein